jgi:hypothetical protein
MRHRTLAFLALGLFVLMSGLSASAADEALRLARENARLEAELKLARKPGVYFVVDSAVRKVLVRSRGMSLKEIPIAGLSTYGGGVKAGPHNMLAKSGFHKPERKEIKPEKPSEVPETDLKAVLDFYDLADMPRRYGMVLEGGIAITVRPAPEGVLSSVLDKADAVLWQAARPFVSLWHRLKKRPYAALRITVPPDGARALYWAAYEGSPWVVDLR